MEKSILFAGFGGQGVQTLGKLLAYAANEEEKYVTFSPAYGGEMRGGTSNCTVIVSDRQIGSPTREKLDMVVAMNIESFRRFEPQVKPGGLLICNDSLIPLKTEREDITQVNIPANELALEAGSDKTLNVIMLGFIAAHYDLVSKEAAEKIVDEKLGKKEKFRAMNQKAFILGANYNAGTADLGNKQGEVGYAE